MHLATTELFRARWTEQIHDEWIRNVLANRKDLKPAQLERTRALMNENVLDCLVTGYEKLIDGLTLPDPGDRHVLAAAIRSQASIIVTFNLKHFPAQDLTQYGIEALHPDDFVMHQMDLSQGAVCGAAKRHRKSLRKPAKTVEEYLNTLANQQLPKTVLSLREFSDLI